jgi:hypothetical protein
MAAAINKKAPHLVKPKRGALFDSIAMGSIPGTYRN